MRKPSKYRAKKVHSQGLTFDSKKEHRRWCELQLLERGGVIAGLKRQVRIVLYGRDGPLQGPSGRLLTYVADFTYRENDVDIVEDVKGYKTDVYRLKRAILAAQGVVIKET